MGKVTTYNPRQVNIALGTHLASGLADDSFISIESTGDGTTAVTGVDGEVARSIDPTKTYTLKISLLQNSATNDFLYNQYTLDQENGNGMFGVNIQDLTGNQQFKGATAWVNKVPAFERGKAQGNRDWELTVADGEFK